MPSDASSFRPVLPDDHRAVWGVFSAGGCLLLISWLIAQSPPVPDAASIEDVSPTYNLMAAGALPWLLQWAGTTCLMLCCFRSRLTRNGFLFAVLTSLTLAATWWFGLAYRFQGMDPLDVLVDLILFELQSQFGSSTVFDDLLFHFVGPILGLVQGHGPVGLSGWSFLWSLLSTALLVGYLTFVGSLCLTGSRSSSGNDYVKFMALMLVVYVPPVVWQVIRFPW